MHVSCLLYGSTLSGYCDVRGCVKRGAPREGPLRAEPNVCAWSAAALREAALIGIPQLCATPPQEATAAGSGARRAVALLGLGGSGGGLPRLRHLCGGGGQLLRRRLGGGSGRRHGGGSGGVNGDAGGGRLRLQLGERIELVEVARHIRLILVRVENVAVLVRRRLPSGRLEPGSGSVRGPSGSGSGPGSSLA